MINTRQTDLAAVRKLGEEVQLSFSRLRCAHACFVQVQTAVNKMYKEVEIGIDGIFKVGFIALVCAIWRSAPCCC